MCGLAGGLSLGSARPTHQALAAMFLYQRIRGKDSSGVAYLKDGHVLYMKRDVVCDEFIRDDLPEYWPDITASPTILMHARHATQGKASDNKNNHPVVAGDWVVTHNGHVRNDRDLVKYYGMDRERPAEVDTVAINLALSQGETIEQSIAHLSLLDGTATFMAIPLRSHKELLIGRINGPPLYLHLDKRDRILYWSSDVDGLRPTGKGGWGTLKFVNVSVMPNNTVFHYNGSELRQYTIDVRPFRMPNPPQTYSPLPTVYQPKGKDREAGKPTGPLVVVGSNFPATTPAPTRTIGHDTSPIGNTDTNLTNLSNTVDKWLTKVRNALLPDTEPLILTEKMGVSIVNFTVEEGKSKPAPCFEPGMVGLADMPPKIAAQYTTPYGTWLLTPNARWFRGAKRVKAHFGKLRQALGVEINLPAPSRIQEALHGYYRLEIIKLFENKDQVTQGLMCPMCGIIARYHVWQQNGWTCSWCRVHSRLKFTAGRN